MNHSLTAEGFGVRLRPVRMQDAAFIVWLRNLDYVRGKVGDSAPDVASQEKWLAAYFKREGDYYFIVETLGGIPAGTYGVYNISGASAEQGRWIMRKEVPVALPSVMTGFDLAFEQLGLRELRGTTVATNRMVISINRKCGFRRVKIEPAGQLIGGQAVDMLHFVLSPEDWSRAREQLVPLARVAEVQIRDWENAQPRNQTMPQGET
jgi:RimJ/RimL family protein N-acetyltransferase